MQWKTSIVFTFSPTQGVSFFRPLKSERNFPEQNMNTIDFFMGGADFTKGSKPGYLKTENLGNLGGLKWSLKRWICSEKSALCIHANNSIWSMQGGIPTTFNPRPYSGGVQPPPPEVFRG